MKTDTICADMLSDCCISERPRYFPRQLITPADMILEQEYFRNKLRRHNRLLHGWGVVCGALVCLFPKADANEPEPWKVLVKPGYILGPYGDEITIDCDRTLDLRTMCVTGVSGDPCVEPVDPWCSEIFVNREGGPLFVAVRYKEIMARPVRVQPVGCGCDETQCEYSRWCDGYEICVLTECPESHKTPPKLEDLAKGPIPNCPLCPPDPWVVLAKVEVDENGVIKEIDNCSCRRLVTSFGHFWWKCEGGVIQVENVDVLVEGKKVEAIDPGRRDVLIEVRGINIRPGANVSLGRDVVIREVKMVKDRLEIRAEISENAAPGPRTITVTNPDGVVGMKPNAFTIRRKEVTPTPTPKPTKEEKPIKKTTRPKGEEETPTG